MRHSTAPNPHSQLNCHSWACPKVGTGVLTLLTGFCGLAQRTAHSPACYNLAMCCPMWFTRAQPQLNGSSQLSPKPAQPQLNSSSQPSPNSAAPAQQLKPAQLQPSRSRQSRATHFLLQPSRSRHFSHSPNPAHPQPTCRIS